MEPKVDKTEARQGEPRIMARRTLAISLGLAVLAMIIIWAVFA